MPHTHGSQTYKRQPEAQKQHAGWFWHVSGWGSVESESQIEVVRETWVEALRNTVSTCAGIKRPVHVAGRELGKDSQEILPAGELQWHGQVHLIAVVGRRRRKVALYVDAS